jgi:hypothetical protein
VPGIDNSSSNKMKIALEHNTFYNLLLLDFVIFVLYERS